MKYKVGYGEKRALGRYESVNIGIEVEHDTAVENITIEQAFNMAKAAAYLEVDKALKGRNKI